MYLRSPPLLTIHVTLRHRKRIKPFAKRTKWRERLRKLPLRSASHAPLTVPQCMYVKHHALHSLYPSSPSLRVLPHHAQIGPPQKKAVMQSVGIRSAALPSAGVTLNRASRSCQISYKEVATEPPFNNSLFLGKERDFMSVFLLKFYRVKVLSTRLPRMVSIETIPP